MNTRRKGPLMLTKTFSPLLGYNGHVRVVKPTRKRGQELRDVPIYTIAEAASALAIPPRTFFSWFVGPNRIYEPAGEYDSYSLLSFKDAAEAYRLFVLREIEGLHPKAIRDYLQRLRKYSSSKHPLTDLDIILSGKTLFYNKPSRRGKAGFTVDLSGNDQLAMRQIIEAWGKRIVQDDKKNPLQILPWRHFSVDANSTPVSLDPEVMSGSPVVTGTRIPVGMLRGMKRAGKSEQQIAESYRLPIEAVKKALQHFEQHPLQKVA